MSPRLRVANWVELGGAGDGMPGIVGSRGRRADWARPVRQFGFLCKCKTHRNPRDGRLEGAAAAK